MVVVVDGTVAAKGLVNTLEEIDGLLDTALERAARAAAERLARRLALGTTRRSFLARVGALTAGWRRGAARATVPGAERSRAAGTASAATTSRPARVPAPYRLPRVDARGFPLRPEDGHPIDNLGRPINGARAPIDSRGRRARGPDGRRCRAPRTRICEDWVPERHGVDAVAPGRLVPLLQRPDAQARGLLLDEHAPHQRRRARCVGYCYRGRRVLLRHLLRHGLPC